MLRSAGPYIAFVYLVLFFTPWPLISLTLGWSVFVSRFLYPEERTVEKVEEYLPRLPTEILAHIASILGREDLVRLGLGSRATYYAANKYLYRRIVLDEHSSPNVPWFRRRLYRLYACLTKRNAAYIRHIDFSGYIDINHKYLSSILEKCIHLDSLSLPAIQEPIPSRFGKKGLLIKQPVFLTTALCTAIPAGITQLTWTGPFIPFRGESYYAGRDFLRIFRNLRSLKSVFRDTFATEESLCANAYSMSMEDIGGLVEDLSYMAKSCPVLTELTLPFWEPVYAAGMFAFKSFPTLRRIQFLTVDKNSKNGGGLLKFIAELGKVGIGVTFLNPLRRKVDIISLVEEFESVQMAGEAIQHLPPSQEIIYGPLGPALIPWHDHENILDRLEWIPPADNRKLTLHWPVTNEDSPAFTIPPIFSGIQFQFNTPVQRGDARQYLNFVRYITEAVEFAHLRRIRVDMELVDAFYLAFPFFMQFYENRILTLRVERLPLSGNGGFWIRREWTLKRGTLERTMKLEELGSEGIHAHPVRLFEKIMTGLMFRGERSVMEIICVFYDRYSTTRGL